MHSQRFRHHILNRHAKNRRTAFRHLYGNTKGANLMAKKDFRIYCEEDYIDHLKTIADEKGSSVNAPDGCAHGVLGTAIRHA